MNGRQPVRPAELFSKILPCLLFQNLLTMKILFALILITAHALYEFWKNHRSKQFAKNLLRQLDANPAFANDIAAEMQHLYGYESNPNMLSLKDLLVNIEAGERVGDFEILRKIEFDNSSFLFVTMSHEKHYATDKYGNEQMSVRNYQLSFLIKNDAQQKQTGVWSDQYENLSKKNLRRAFARELFQRTFLQ